MIFSKGFKSCHTDEQHEGHIIQTKYLHTHTFISLIFNHMCQSHTKKLQTCKCILLGCLSLRSFMAPIQQALCILIPKKICLTFIEHLFLSKTYVKQNLDMIQTCKCVSCPDVFHSGLLCTELCASLFWYIFQFCSTIQYDKENG